MKKLICLMPILCLVLFACSNTKDAYSKYKTDLYMCVFEDLIGYDTDLNNNMKLIGIYFGETDISDEELKVVIDGLSEKTSIPVSMYSPEQKRLRAKRI